MKIISMVCAVTGTFHGSVHAADWYTGQNAPPQSEKWIVELDASVTVGSNKTAFAGASATFAPIGSMRQSGFRGRIEGLAGTYSYEATSPVRQSIKSHQQSGAISAGYSWVARDTTISGYVGLVVQNTDLSQPDPNNSVVGTGVGVKFAGDFYTRPVPDMMISGYASYATLHNSYYSRLKFGWTVADEVFLGPEFGLLGDDFYGQYRLGAHLTGFRLGALQVGVAGGFMYDRDRGAGGYGTVDARVGF